MSQAGYTPISLYYSTTASAVPSSGNLVNGELALNTADMKLYAKNSSGVVTLLASSGGAAGTVSSVAVSGGTTGLTTSGGPITTSGTITLAGTLNVANGGTGLTSLTAGYIPYGNGTSALASSSSLFFDGTNLGIGTSSPSFKLQVEGAANSAALTLLRLNNSGTTGGGPGIASRISFTAGATALGFIQGSNFASGAAGLQFSGDGTNAQATLDSSGNLGLGVAPSAWGSNYKAIQIGAQGSLHTYVGVSMAMSANAYDSGAGTWKYIANNYACRFVQDPSNGQSVWQNAALGTAGAALTWITALSINNSGAIGVGSSPSYGTSGQVLTSAGSGSAPTWTTPASGGGSFTAKTTNYTAASGDNILADTSSASWTLTLPASPTTGNSVQVMDSKGSFGQYPLTVARNGSTIMSASEDMTLAVNGAATTFVYNGSTWRVI